MWGGHSVIHVDFLSWRFGLMGFSSRATPRNLRDAKGRSQEWVPVPFLRAGIAIYIAIGLHIQVMPGTHDWAVY